MTDTFDPNRRTPEVGGDPSNAGDTSMSGRAGEDLDTQADGLEPEHDQPAEGGVEEAEDGDGDTAPGR